jgi:hypothetical protein
MSGIEARETNIRERLTAILRSTPPLMQVLSVARGLCLSDWLVFRARFTSLYSIT